MRLNDSLHISQLRVVVHLCGFLVLLYSFSMLPPMTIALLNKERSLFAFFSTFMTFFTLGGGAWLATKHAGIQLRTRDGFVIIVLFWLLFSFISAMPMWMDDGLNLSFADALFEGVSGITTTGATVIGDVSAMPKSYLYYRAQLNFIGGLGVIVLAVAVLPLLGIGGMKLYQSEMPGPFKEERLTPRLADTARTLWLTYVILGLICTWPTGLPGCRSSMPYATGCRRFLSADFPLAVKASASITAMRSSWSLGCFPCCLRLTSPSGTWLS